MAQPVYLPLIFHPFQSEEARRLCPELPRFQPERQLVLLSNEGGVYLGEDAWLMCMYALREYRVWALRMAAPALKPLAHRLCIAISHNRLALSNALFISIKERSRA